MSIRVKDSGWTGFSSGWQGCSAGFPEGKAKGKSRGAALPAQGKPRPSGLFYSYLHSISKTICQSTEVSRRVNFLNAISAYFDDKLQILTQLSFHEFFVQNIFFDKLFCCRTPVKSCKKALKDYDESWSKPWVEYHIFSWDQFFRTF